MNMKAIFAGIEHYLSSGENKASKILATSWLVSSVGRALHRYCKGHGFKFRTGLNILDLVFISAKITFVFIH